MSSKESVLQGFLALLEKTDVMKGVLKSAEEGPARLPCRICEEYQRTGCPVPDNKLLSPATLVKPRSELGFPQS